MVGFAFWGLPAALVGAAFKVALRVVRKLRVDLGIFNEQSPALMIHKEIKKIGYKCS